MLKHLLHRLCNLVANVLRVMGLSSYFYTRPIQHLSIGDPSQVRVVFVCKGNICRSPYAAKKFMCLLAEVDMLDKFSVTSCGLETRPGLEANSTAVIRANLRGVDLSQHRTKPADKALLSEADLIFFMEPGHKAHIRKLSNVAKSKAVYLGALSLEHTGSLIIPDPYGRPAEVFDRIFDMIDLSLGKLIDTIHELEHDV